MSTHNINPELHIFRSPKFESVVKEALNFFHSTPIQKLPPIGRFSSGGVYALYYIGNFSHYKKVASKNRNSCISPIYVGKAVLPGWRTARATNKKEATSLYSRLREHARSITQVSNLDITDFRVRFMILEKIESDLVVPVESELIRKFKPLWNTMVDGFGNHDPGSGRYNQAKSEWDILHPGRPWADRLTGVSPRLESIIKKLKHHGK